MKQRIPTAVAVTIGLITLVGIFLAPYLPDFQFHLLFIQWAATLVGVALWIGIFNLLGVHVQRIVGQERNWPYSIFLILSALATMIIGFLVPGEGPSGEIVGWMFRYILVPLEAAAASLLIFFLVAAAFRAMRKQPSWWTFLFVATIVVVLLGTIPFSGELGGLLVGVRSWITRVFATAGARGVLLGVALGTIATGLRVLVGIDRPHSEREP